MQKQAQRVKSNMLHFTVAIFSLISAQGVFQNRNMTFPNYPPISAPSAYKRFWLFNQFFIFLYANMFWFKYSD